MAGQILVLTGVFGLCERAWGGLGGLLCHHVHPYAPSGRGESLPQFHRPRYLSGHGNSRSSE
jgi:hypothetical protein